MLLYYFSINFNIFLLLQERRFYKFQLHIEHKIFFPIQSIAAPKTPAPLFSIRHILTAHIRFHNGTTNPFCRVHVSVRSKKIPELSYFRNSATTVECAIWTDEKNDMYTVSKNERFISMKIAFGYLSPWTVRSKLFPLAVLFLHACHILQQCMVIKRGSSSRSNMYIRNNRARSVALRVSTW